MKKVITSLVPALVVIFLFSCSLDDDGFNNREGFIISAVPVDSVSIQDPTSPLGSATRIDVYFTLEECETFYGMDYDRDQNERTVTMFSLRDTISCSNNTRALRRTINFRPLASGTYNFRFWMGKDDNIFLERDVTISEQ